MNEPLPPNQPEARQGRRWGVAVAGLLVGALFVSFIALLTYGMLNREPSTASSAAERTGKQAPDFALMTLDGQREVRLADFAGRPIVLNFWASWCAPCRAEMPHLIEAFDRHNGAGVVFIGVDVQDTRQDAQRFLQEFGVPVDEGYLILVDATGAATIDYGVAGLPVTLFIDGNGVVQKRWVGAVNGQLLEEYIAAIARPIASSPALPARTARQ